MIKQTKLCCGLMALYTAFYGYVAAEAADVNAESKTEARQESAEEQPAPPVPIVIEGDDISFDNTTGDVYAKGNVTITQTDARLAADDIRGNTKSADVWIDGKAHITQDEMGIDLNGYDSFYNYQIREGKMARVVGEADRKYIKGENVEFYPDEIIIYNGTVTKCPAKKPDYHISASKIEIWPDNKMIAHDAKFWIKDKVLYSTKRYETKIGKNTENTAFPTVGYRSDDGIFIKQRLEHSLSENLSLYADLGYYSRHDFRANYGAVNYNNAYIVKLEAGDFQDDDDEWIKKEPELSIDFARRRIGDTPFMYDINGKIGRWKDDKKKSWHQEYSVYFSHDPIELGDSLNLHLGAGYEFIKESYDGSKLNTLKQDITLVKDFSPRFTVWTGYHYTKRDNERALFKYDSADVGKELASGFRYKIDNKNAIGVKQSYDIANRRTADMDYTWYRDLHCWQLELTYREKRDELKVKANIAAW